MTGRLLYAVGVAMIGTGVMVLAGTTAAVIVWAVVVGDTVIAWPEPCLLAGLALGQAGGALAVVGLLGGRR